MHPTNFTRALPQNTNPKLKYQEKYAAIPFGKATPRVSLTARSGQLTKMEFFQQYNGFLDAQTDA